MKTLYCIILSASFVYGVFAQSGSVKPATPEQKAEPTMQETVDWLEGNLPSKAIYSGKIQTLEINSKVTEVSLAKCTCGITASEEFLTKAQFTIRRVNIIKIAVPLASLNPVSVEVKARGVGAMQPEAFDLTILTADDKKVVQVETYREESYFGKSKDIKMANKFAIMFDSKENAQRIAKAFQHLITLCRATDKKEPF